MLLLLPVWLAAAADIDAATHYTNQFAVRVASVGGDHGLQADRVARKHGFLNRGQVSFARPFTVEFPSERTAILKYIFNHYSIIILYNILIFSNFHLRFENFFFQYKLSRLSANSISKRLVSYVNKTDTNKTACVSSDAIRTAIMVIIEIARTRVFT